MHHEDRQAARVASLDDGDAIFNCRGRVRTEILEYRFESVEIVGGGGGPYNVLGADASESVRGMSDHFPQNTVGSR